MKIRVRKTDRFTGEMINDTTYDNETDAFAALKRHAVGLTEEHMAEIMAYPTTHFDNFEMVNCGDAAYSANVAYDIEVTK